MAGVHPLPPPPALAELSARHPVALFIDFDGTLVELACAPNTIRVPEDLAARLGDLSDRFDGRVALVSGRDLDDMEKHLGECRIARAGSHGASRRCREGHTIGTEPGPLPEDAVAAMRVFAEAQGLAYEPKRHGGAIHFRTAPETGDAVQAFARTLANRHVLEVKLGKAVVELVHPGASKSAAVRLFMTTTPFAGALPVFLGDDVTDEDGFAAANAAGGFGIAVGERPGTAAQFGLGDVTAVHRWLGL